MKTEPNSLMRRFKVVALFIISDERLDFLSEKVAITADAIDSNHQQSEDMVAFLEDAIINILEV